MSLTSFRPLRRLSRALKPSYLCLAALLYLCPQTLLSYDWRVQPSEELRAELARKELIPRLPKDDRWIARAMQWVDEELLKVPPTLEVDSNYARRREILLALDYPLHVNNFEWLEHDRIEAFNRPILTWYRQRLDRILAQLDRPVPPEVLYLHKIYNMGFVLRQGDRMVGVDIATGPVFPTLPRTKEGAFKGVAYAMDVQRAEKLARKLDLLLVTHPHRDHYNVPLIRAMQALGKPVIFPCPLYSRKDRLESAQTHYITNTIITPTTIGGLKLAALRGHQGPIPCNVYWFEFGGYHFVHTGDNSDRKLEERLAELPRADFLITACWNHLESTTRAALSAKGDRPLILVPSHDNEMGHSVPHRESWQELFYRKDRLGNPNQPMTPVLILAPGETISFGEKSADAQASAWQRFWNGVTNLFR